MRTPAGSIAATWARRSGLPEGRIVGRREIAAMLGVTRQRVGQIVRDDRSFPVNLTRLSSGALWYAAGIEIWIAGHLDRGRQWASHVPRYARELRPEDRHDRDRRPHAEAGSS